MPRTTSQIKLRLHLPTSMLATLHAVAHAEQTPAAELLRRAADLSIIFGLPPPKLPRKSYDHETSFVFFLPESMLDDLKQTAFTRHYDPNDLILQVLEIYFAKRAVVTSARVTASPQSHFTPQIATSDIS